MLRCRTRWASRLSSWAAVCGFGLAAVLPARAQAPVSVGGEFQVNTYTTNSQQSPSVAVASGGDFVVVWQSYGSSGTDTDGQSIQGQRYASNGSPQGAQFQVNTYTTYTQYGASVGADEDGDFVVVWTSFGSSGTDTSYDAILGQRYASDGSTLGGEFQVNTYTTYGQSSASVTVAPDGDFVVVWYSNGSPGTDTDVFSVQGQRYASNGSTQGAQFQVNNYTTSNQLFPSVAADAGGDFVVTWTSYGSSGTDTSYGSIQGQRFASDGSTQGAQFQVNTYTTYGQYVSSVAVDADGDFVVVWRSSGSSGTDTSDQSIQGQRYASDGSTQGAEFQVNTYTTSSQGAASVAAAAAGDFVVTWSSYGSSGTDTSGESVQGQRYASDGSTQGLQFQVNTDTSNDQTTPSVAAAPDSDFVVVWRSSPPSEFEASSRAGSSGPSPQGGPPPGDIRGQRYFVPPPVPSMSPATIAVLGAVLLLFGSICVQRLRA